MCELLNELVDYALEHGEKIHTGLADCSIRRDIIKENFDYIAVVYKENCLALSDESLVGEAGVELQANSDINWIDLSIKEPYLSELYGRLVKDFNKQELKNSIS